MVLNDSLTFERSLDLLAPALQPAYYRQRPLGLMNGLSGLALTCGYLSRYIDDRYAGVTEELVDYLTDEIAEGQLRTSTVHTLSTGLGGILYTLDHLRELGCTDQRFSDASFSGLVDIMVDQSLRNFTDGNSDYLHGPLGVFLTLLYQWPRAGTEAGMDRIFEAYQKQVKWDDRGARCFNSVLEGQTGEEYNFGLAHGMSGHVLIWAEAYRRGYRRAETARLMEGLLRYMESYRKPARPREHWQVFYPKAVIENDAAAWAEKEEENYQSRIGWCYGDLNVAVAQLKSGYVTGNRKLSRAGLRLARHTATRRDPEDSQVNRNAFFCHGASGNTFMYEALYQRTGNLYFRGAAEHWGLHLDELLESDAYREIPERHLSSILSGGTGLVLAQIPLECPGVLPAADLFLLNL